MKPSIKSNSDLDFLYARLAEIRMSEHDRVRAKASLARAEAMAELIAQTWRAIRRLGQKLLVRPIRRLTTNLG